MDFIEYNFTISPPTPWSEILLAKLSQIEFDSFEENDTGLKGYIKRDFDDEEFVQEQIGEMEGAQITYEKQNIQQVNWNEEWEKNFQPISVDDRCYIRAEFHEEKPNVKYDIVIQPKMSFGTGHHETTHLLIEFILDTEFDDKVVLDMGTGTGILGILAKMRGAKSVDAIDIDEWSYENAIENAERNKVDIQVMKGGAESIPSSTEYDIILANINKNVLIEDMPFYVNQLKKGGTLFLSGLYNFDEDDIRKETEKYGLTFEAKRIRNEWIALKFNY
ncbi:50S ribosomal protein L11 methyltransferase [Weeksellaceae bacterium KMM 9724]|uniref:50S ribosomal protein L11 methyltransferase n=1 Tax=Profundicola chukchiensis TaxID=2961959 RepID=UPI00243DA101|nr:50S ribosomal protein L11 methyltransferase [Profundicola chukchiensis]MDG4951227.1 50S ribosomal protein L11 methyltransferase [Profundicola chukchiensis]